MKNDNVGTLARYPRVSSMLMTIAEVEDPLWAASVIQSAKLGRGFAMDLVTEAIRRRHEFGNSAALREVSISLSHQPSLELQSVNRI